MSGGRGAVARLTGLAVLGLLVAAGLGLVTTSVTSQTVGLSGEGASVSEELVASDQAASNRARDAARRDRRQRERDAATSPTSPQADFAVPPAGEEPGEDESDGEADSGPDGNGGVSGSDGNESRGSGSDDDD